jgi:hypothetical protein
MIRYPDGYYCSNYGQYVANEDPIYFIGKMILCKYCPEHDPMLKIMPSRRYMIQNDFKSIEYSLKYNKNGKKQNFTLRVVGFSERIFQLLGTLKIIYYVI